MGDKVQMAVALAAAWNVRCPACGEWVEAAPGRAVWTPDDCVGRVTAECACGAVVTWADLLLKQLLDRLGLSLREDDQRPEGAPRFTASIPGAGRGDGHTPDEAIDKLRARLTENAGPVHVVQARAAEAQRIANAMNGGLIDIWTDLGKPDIGPESFVEALVAACRGAIAALRASCDAANHLGFFVCQDFGRPGFTAYILNVGRGNGTTMDEAVTALRARLIEDAAKAGTMIAAHKEYTRTVEYLDWATIQAERQRDEAQAWAEAFAAELSRRCARDPDEVARAEAMHGQLVATMPEWEQANCANKAERVARRRSSERGVGRGFDRPHTEWTEGDRD